jgi:uncharacterized membrane protein
MGSKSRHMPFYVAAASGAAVLLLAYWLAPQIAVTAAANAFFLIYLVLTGLNLPTLTADFLREHAEGADEPAWLIFAVTFGAVVVAIGSLFLLVNEGGAPAALDLTLSLASVGLGWLMIHTMAALHYAHRYWRPNEPSEGEGKGGGAPGGGLDFPGDADPGAYDFLYFSFVTGMTAQTSDIAITNTAMRKLNLLHAVVSFFFNTVLVAAAVNLAVSLGG